MSALGDLNETFAYVYFFRLPSICNASNKGRRRSPRSVYMEKFNLRNIREPNRSNRKPELRIIASVGLRKSFLSFPKRLGMDVFALVISDAILCDSYYTFLLATQVIYSRLINIESYSSSCPNSGFYIVIIRFSVIINAAQISGCKSM